jgi:hypothetical protein
MQQNNIEIEINSGTWMAADKKLILRITTSRKALNYGDGIRVLTLKES